VEKGDSVPSHPRVAIIVLNYNGWCDTIECVSLLTQQTWPEYLIVVVDNASSNDSVEKMKAAWGSGGTIKYWAEYDKKDAETGGTEEKENELEKYKVNEKVVLIRNDQNLGYSAGNNVGIRYALKRKYDAVFIVNPDVLLEGLDDVGRLVTTLFDNIEYCVAGPRVLDADSRDQNPMREPPVTEEIFGTLWKGVVAATIKDRRMSKAQLVRSSPYPVGKISGCCVMIKSDFLINQGLLDENIFMYSEEAVLAHNVLMEYVSIANL
jgi:GT2 family glycosyltransferase